jgi:hypothetical protein
MSLLRELGKDGVTLVAVADSGAHLHELMSAQCGLELGGDCRSEAALADQHDGIARVGEAAEMLFLFLGQIRLHA